MILLPIDAVSYPRRT